MSSALAYCYYSFSYVQPASTWTENALTPSEVKRLKQLEDENQRLKKIVADLPLDQEMLQDVIRQRIQGLHGSGR